jgi:hypothetical protein
MDRLSKGIEYRLKIVHGSNGNSSFANRGLTETLALFCQG